MEAVIVVCDRGDDRPATESVRFTLGNRNLQLDLCQQHLTELAKGAHPVKRGRQRSASTNGQPVARKATAKRRGRPPGSKNRKR
jgi:hypothetical protein